MFRATILVLGTVLGMGFLSGLSAQDERDLTDQQRAALVAHAKTLSPEKRQELRDNPGARAEFVREASASLPPAQRKDLQARLDAMTAEQRRATLKSIIEESRGRRQTSLGSGGDTRDLTDQQRAALVAHAKTLSPEKRQELRDDPGARAEFVREASASLPPAQRKDLQARLDAMTAEQRRATLKSIIEESRGRRQTSMSN